MSTPTQPLPGRTDGPAVHAEIRRFVSAVEGALDDLPAEDVTELVGGLEADLTEAWVTEGTTPAQRFGSPEAYAGELRAAAGLPPRRAGTASRGGLAGLTVAVRSVARDARATVTGMPGWSQVRDLLVSLRPVWWALRGYVAYLLLVQVVTRAGVDGHAVPGPWPLRALLIALVVVSVEIGRRGARMRNAVGRGLLVAMNVVALLALYDLIGPASSTPISWGSSGYVEEQQGLKNDGYQVVNVFPYDAEGKPLEGVQLFDDRGRPLQVPEGARGYLDATGKVQDLVPAIGEDGRQRWNVYPMREALSPDSALTGEDTEPRDATRPDPTQSPLLDTGSGTEEDK